MTYVGTVQHGVVVLDSQGAIAEGTRVRVVPLPLAIETTPPDGMDDPLFRMDELAVETGIADLATNHDYYLYGHPKSTDARE